MDEIICIDPDPGWSRNSDPALSIVRIQKRFRFRFRFCLQLEMDFDPVLRLAGSGSSNSFNNTSARDPNPY